MHNRLAFGLACTPATSTTFRRLSCREPKELMSSIRIEQPAFVERFNHSHWLWVERAALLFDL